jgi:dephospho-CoA kinase
MNDKLVIGLAGMPGAGKSAVVAVAKDNGYGVVVMGDVVREEAKNRRLEPSPKNLGKIMLKLRQKEGNSVIAKRCISKIESEANTRLLWTDSNTRAIIKQCSIGSGSKDENPAK